MTTPIKIPKDNVAKLFADAEWVTNGHVALRREWARRAGVKWPGVLDTYVRTLDRFAWDGHRLTSGADADVPDIHPLVIAEFNQAAHGLKPRLPVEYFHRVKSGGLGGIVILTDSDGEPRNLTTIDMVYLPLLEVPGVTACATAIGDPTSVCLVDVATGELVGVVMVCRVSADVKEQWGSLLDLAGIAQKLWEDQAAAEVSAGRT